MHDIVIIGAGPAGLTAAVYAERAGKNALLIEGDTFGGQITYSPRVENYPGIKSISGNEFADSLLQQAIDLGAETEFNEVVGLKVCEGGYSVLTSDGSHMARAVIIASGVKHRKLGLEGEDALTGSGVSYCAVCDGAFYKGRPVAVVGGGNTALSDALFLSSYCSKVTVIHRRDKFRGEERLLEYLKQKSNVEFVLNAEVAALMGEDALSGIKIKEKLSGKIIKVEADCLFVAIGQESNNAAFKELVMLDGDGYIIAGEDCKTTQKGIFAAGDCRVKDVRQLTTAAADGAVAALNACKYIDELYTNKKL